MGDARIEWLRETVGFFIECPQDRWSAMVADRGQSQTNGAAIDAFLGSAPKGASMFIYAVNVEEKQEVRTLKEVPNPKYKPPPPPPEEDEEDVPADEGEDAEGKAKEGAEGAGAGAAEGEGEAGAAPAEAAGPAPPPEPEFISEVEVTYTMRTVPAMALLQ